MHPVASRALTAANSTHVALVIGNSTYELTTPLANPGNDSADLAETLAGMGYDVNLLQDASYEEMRSALQAFSAKARRAEVSLVFFAGHGIEVEKKNYLIPVDADLKTGHDVEFQAISLDMVQRAASGAKRLNVIILDACRDNPFLKAMRSTSGASRSSLPGGLASIEPDAGTVVGFAAKEGTTASDGIGRNSPYTTALLKHISTRGLDVGQMFRIIRDEVLGATGREQEPFLYGSLPAGTVSLHPEDRHVTTTQTTLNAVDPKAPSEPPERNLEDARLAWEAVRDSNVISDFDVIISAYSGTIYEQLALGRKKQLQASLSPDTDLQTFSPERKSWFLATYANLDLFGGDIHPKGLLAGSVAECAQSCGDETACRAFTYNAEAGRCFLKSSYSFAQVYDGAVAGYYFQGSSEREAPSVRASWELFSRRDLTGNDLGATADLTFPGCMEACTKHSSCSGFTFAGFLKRNRCWLKSGFSNQPYVSGNTRKGLISARRIDRVVAPGRVHAVTAVD